MKKHQKCDIIQGMKDLENKIEIENLEKVNKDLIKYVEENIKDIRKTILDMSLEEA